MAAWLALWLLLALAPDDADTGLKALEAKDYAAAVAAFTKAAAAGPKDYSAYFHLGLAYSLVGKDAEAVAAYQKTLELKPGLYEAELNLGIVLNGRKEFAAALPLLRSAAGRKPSLARPRLYLADALLGSGDLAGAETEYRATLTAEAKNTAAALGLARALARQNRLDDAAAFFRQAAQSDPSYREALLELAELYEKAHSAEEAIPLYEQFPDNSGAQERLGLLYLETKRYPEAIARLEKVVAAAPTSASRVALATAYRRAGEPQKAMPLVEQTVAAEPASFDLRMMYGAMLRDQRKFPAAAQQFFAAAKLNANSKEAWSELAGVLILAESYPEALAALDRVRALGAETAAHHFFRAIVLDKTRQYKPALESYQTFLQTAGGKFPDEEFQARQRIKVIQKELSRR